MIFYDLDFSFHVHEERQVKKYVNERQFHNSQNVTANLVF